MMGNHDTTGTVAELPPAESSDGSLPKRIWYRRVFFQATIVGLCAFLARAGTIQCDAIDWRGWPTDAVSGHGRQLPLVLHDGSHMCSGQRFVEQDWAKKCPYFWDYRILYIRGKFVCEQ